MHRSRLLLLPVVLLTALLSLSPSLLAQSAPDGEPPRDIDALVHLYDRPAPAEGFLAQVDELTLPQDAPATPELATNLADWSRIAFMTGRHDKWSIYTMRPDFNDVVPALVTAEHNMYPSLRRAANRIVFVSERHNNIDIYSARADGGEVVRLTNHEADDLNPAWSPDGTQIAFQSERTGESDIYVMNADGSGLRRLTSSNGYDGQPSWSPDGRAIAFSSNATGLYQIWVMAADGSGQRPLTTFQLAALYPAWSPDGTQIAFSGVVSIAAEDFFLDLFIMNADGTNSRPSITVPNTDIRGLTWAPDTSHAAYIASHYEKHGNEWWLTSSYLHLAYFNGSNLEHLGAYIYDNIVWNASWASTDTQAPTPCTVNTPANRAWRNGFVTWSASDDLSGVAGYDVEWRLAGESGWHALSLPRRDTTQAWDERAPGDVVEWRCRATDRSGNRADWAAAPIKRTLVDGAPPVSYVASVSPVDGDTVQVTWRGTDFGSGVAHYTIWTRQGTEGDWTRWQTGTTATGAAFTGQTGQTYYFRSQAVDRTGLREAWQPAPQAQATLGAPDAPAAPQAPAEPEAIVQVMMPAVLATSGSAAAQDMLSAADWPTLGGNPAHTGVNLGDPGASRYALAWSAELDLDSLVAGPQMTSAGGVILIAPEDSGPHRVRPTVIALNAESGAELWHFDPVAGRNNVSHPPTIAHGIAYLAEESYDGCILVAADLFTGRVHWAVDHGCDSWQTFQHPVVAGNRLYISGRLGEFNVATGAPRWFTDYSTSIDGWTPAYLDGRLYARGQESLGVWNVGDGQPLWSIDGLGSDEYLVASTPVVTGDTAIVTGYNLYAVDTRTHQVRWTIEGTEAAHFTVRALPAVAGRVVYALRGPTLLAYNLDTGAELWHYTAGGPLLSAPVVAGKYVIVASAGHTYVLDRFTHAVVWDVAVGGVVSLANGYLFVAETVSPDDAPSVTVHAFRAQES